MRAMRFGFAFAVGVFAGLTGEAAFAADPAAKDSPSRIETVPIQSMTLSDSQFLKGENGTPVMVAGELRYPQVGTGRLPVVVLIHGSGGVNAGTDYWERDLNEAGIATFLLDGLTGRGLTSVATNQALLGRLNLILDAYRVLEVLAKNPRIDPNRIALMGFSRGGQATLYASLNRFNKLWNKSGTEFAAYFPFYPDCATTYVADTEVRKKPIRIFGGTMDDYSPIAKCKPYVANLKSSGADVDLTEYPNASHSFDNPLGALVPAVAKDNQTTRNCFIKEEPEGALINIVSKEPFTYKDPCVQIDPHTGYDPVATQAAHIAVKDFLSKTFKLK